MFDDHNNFIHDCVQFGKNVTLGYHNAIGYEGFGFETENDDGKTFKYPLTLRQHNFGVIIGDNVWIKNNVCIDRGRWRDTVIGRGSQLDNLVHVGHNAIIGADTLITAGTVIGGSCTIGKRVKLYMGCRILPGVKVADDAIIGAGAVVLHDVPENVIMVGNPAYIK